MILWLACFLQEWQQCIFCLCIVLFLQQFDEYILVHIQARKHFNSGRTSRTPWSRLEAAITLKVEHQRCSTTRIWSIGRRCTCLGSAIMIEKKSNIPFLDRKNVTRRLQKYVPRVLSNGYWPNMLRLTTIVFQRKIRTPRQLVGLARFNERTT